MSTEERLDFVRTTISAARRMGMGLRRVESPGDSGMVQFDWVDPMAGIIILGEQAKDPENALELACNRLVDHLTKKETNETPRK